MEKFLRWVSTVQASVIIAGVLISLSILAVGGVLNARDWKLPFLGATQRTTGAAEGTVTVGQGHFPVLGDAKANISIVEFADFRCPFCEKFYTDVESRVINDYVNTGKASFAFRHFAFLGQESVWASEAAECANDQKQFWKFHNWLYDHQAPESNLAYYTKENLIGYATNLGLDTARFSSCLNADSHASEVRGDMEDGQKAGVAGTPTVFINGVAVVGAQPYSVFQQAIEDALKK